MSLPQTLHVYRRRSDVPENADTTTARYVAMGEGLSGLQCRGAIVHERPQNEFEEEWIDQVLRCRLAPGAEIIYLDGPSWDGPRTTIETTD